MKRIRGAVRRYRNRPSGVGVVEYAAGEIAMAAVVIAARRALARGDLHEADHCAAMALYGNSNHTHTACLLPDNFRELGDQFVAASRAARAAEEATR